MMVESLNIQTLANTTRRGGIESEDLKQLDFGTESDLQEKEFLNNLELLEVIGKGSFGKIYKCFHRGLHRFVAVKFIEFDDQEHADYKLGNKERIFLGMIQETASRYLL